MSPIYSDALDAANLTETKNNVRIHVIAQREDTTNILIQQAFGSLIPPTFERHLIYTPTIAMERRTQGYRAHEPLTGLRCPEVLVAFLFISIYLLN